MDSTFLQLLHLIDYKVSPRKRSADNAVHGIFDDTLELSLGGFDNHD